MREPTQFNFLQGWLRSGIARVGHANQAGGLLHVTALRIGLLPCHELRAST